MTTYLTVSALTKYIKYKFDKDPHLQSVLIKGEVSNFKRHSSGHLYFAIKDENSLINAMMFKAQAAKLDFSPKEGDQVLVEARVSVYEQRGSYQIYVNKMQLDGIGNLYQKFEQLKIKLAKEGYFNEEHKKPIPKYPSRIAILTAQTGAAIRDIQNTLTNRYPLAEQVKISTLVQGSAAKDDIIEKLKYADSLNVDTIIIGRGGGSIEDLWNFNEEEVVKAIYHCQTPIISAVGHETDTTLSDFVADVRAATPTQAAMIASPDQHELLQTILQSRIFMTRFMKQYLKHAKQYLAQYASYYKFKQPTLLYEQHIQKRDELERHLHDAIKHRFMVERQNLTMMQQRFHLKHFHQYVIAQQNATKQIQLQLSKLMTATLKNKEQQLIQRVERLNTLSPTQTMLRGYSIVKKDNDIITSHRQLSKGESVEILMKDGSVEAIIEKVRCQNDDKK
ncbi:MULTISPECIES: exodeoxyribonuclease VII large subunit [Staphylococcus]|uniref:Exodeoxyribonuclease 7 large subunit n=1 Tax=Staphylococcus agnetis TaxID=985762 RepID=A0A2T4MJ44_9STAP|nr:MULTISPECIES: exodeoxyribonuclease VII large subunit [Staphylococcus]NHM93260.1 exodeoxyribonuclease VII large subunit [Staphylococcus sp. 10602379]NJI03662.1 exodeoxyribonuclease VII large subunit [Staphylococcus agnetis]NJI14069.1 exodeoxyribonuclease VII large subunit [Staphylococcus agnetis]PTH15239.1 exodeoxyribonuclease VII large subunit [Staphylococcus agnetis]PTH29450.1 exodeoxyribonuclease VII large subunit [Staphylococcus agnetis]